jgi:hypothetical protein
MKKKKSIGSGTTLASIACYNTSPGYVTLNLIALPCLSPFAQAMSAFIHYKSLVYIYYCKKKKSTQVPHC